MKFAEIIKGYHKASECGGEVAREYLDSLDLSHYQMNLLVKMSAHNFIFDEYGMDIEAEYEDAKEPTPGEAEAVRRERAVWELLCDTTQTKIATALGTTQPVISRYARFEREMPLTTYFSLLELAKTISKEE